LVDAPDRHDILTDGHVAVIKGESNKRPSFLSEGWLQSNQRGYCNDMFTSKAIFPHLRLAFTSPLSPQRARWALWAMVGILLLVTASRILRLETLNLQKDEVWTVWITLGTVRQTLDWVGYDWPPAHFLLVHGWRVLTGISPFAMRFSTILTMLLCVALVYRLGMRLFGTRAGVFTAGAFSAFTYMILLSTVVRGYVLHLTVWVWAMILALRYMEKAHPSRLRGVCLGVVMAGMFYVHNTAIFGMAMIGLYTLITNRRPLWEFIRRWLIPAAITAFLCLPEALSKLDAIRQKREIVEKYIPYVPPGERLVNHYLDYVGGQPALWIALFLIAAALVWDRWGVRRRMLAMTAWVLAPVALLWIAAGIDGFQARHLAWVMVGFALWIGAGLALLPRPALIACAAVFAVGMFDRLPLDERYETVQRLPFVTMFSELQGRHRDGDALLLDLTCAGCIPIDAEEWDYFTRAYFPHGGLTFVTAEQIDATPERYPRLWLVTFTGKGREDYRLRAENGRAQGETFGDVVFTFTRYEAPPNPEGIMFVNGIRFHGAELLNDAGLPLVWREGDTVRVRLWWSAAAPQERDFSIGVYFWEEGKGVTAQADGAPALLSGDPATSRWTVGQYYVEERPLTLPYPLLTGNYAIMLSVYQWWDGVRVTAPGVTPDTLLPIGMIYVKSW